MASARSVRILCLSLAAFGMTGCATFEGSPRRLLDETASMSLVNRYQMDTAITNFALAEDTAGNAARGGLTRQQYRDMVVIVYMNAMDARYYQFRTDLSSERRQADFALDLAVLGFTGWASVARASIVNNLSAVAAGFAGARSSVNSNLYFNQTLPALIAAMDAQRLRARARMMTNLQQTAGNYPLPTAFADLMGYEVSSTLDSAISQITGDAAQDRQAAQEELAAVVQSCEPEEGSGEIARAINTYVRGRLNAATPASINELRLAAIGAGVSPTGDPDVVAQAIISRVASGQGGHCRKADLEAMLTRIEQMTGSDL